MYEWLTGHAGDFLYDFIKFCLAYLCSRRLYEGYYKPWKFGGWSVVLINTAAGEQRREIGSGWAEKILSDRHDLSLYLKSFVSPFFYLNMDIGSRSRRHRPSHDRPRRQTDHRRPSQESAQKLNLVGVSHARDEIAASNVAGTARSYGVMAFLRKR